MFLRKKIAKGHEKDPRMPLINGLHYYQTLMRLMEAAQPDWYLEIGSRNGRSLAQCNTNYIAIDPKFALKYDVMNSAQQMLFFQQTSDDFFSTDYLGRNGIQPTMAFIDGMHLFEFVLRDFMNCERVMRPDGLICLHDVCPYNVPQTTRDITYMTELKRPWTGDVWKIITILQEYRPDLDINLLKAETTGFGVVSGLDPASTILRDHYEEILAKYIDLSFEDYGPEAYYQSFELQKPEDFIATL